MTMATFGSRELFPHLESRVYLNHASVAPPSLLVEEAVATWTHTYARLGFGAVPLVMAQRARLKQELATLLGCTAADLALTVSTTRGLLDLAECIPFEPGDRILCFRGEFPANVTPWFAAAHGARAELLPQEGLDDAALLEIVESALRAGGVRLLAFSAVQFATGRAMPVGALTALAHRYGAEVCVDAIQALGVVPLDVTALGIDYLASGAHKWLMGMEGAGFVYAAPSRVAALRPRVAGWLSHEDPLGFLFEGAGKLRYDAPIRHTIDFLEGHSLSAIAFMALGAAVQPLLELGVPAIQAHVAAIDDALEAGLIDRGFTSLRAPGSASGTLSLLPPAGESPVAWAAHFNRLGIAMSGPDGKLRFSPHWPNHLDEVPLVLAAADAWPG